MISINYTPNEWEKGDVLTADQLNATEKALKSIINRLEGKADNGTTDAGDDNTIATVADIKQSINNLNVSTAEGNNLKTITSIGEIAGKINVTYSDIGKANGDTYGIVQAGINLYADNGTLNVIDNPTFTEKLTAQKDVEFGTATVDNGTTSYTHTASIKANTTIYGTAAINGDTTINGSTTINNDINITGTVSIGTGNNITSFNGTNNTIIGTTNISNILNIGTNNNGDYSIAIFNGTNNTIKGTTSILNNLIVGTATTQNGNTTYTGTATFNTTNNILYGDTTISNLTQLNVTGNSYIGGSLCLGSKTILNQNSENEEIIYSIADFNGTDNILHGDTTIDGILTVDGNLLIDGDLIFSSTKTFIDTSHITKEYSFFNKLMDNNGYSYLGITASQDNEQDVKHCLLFYTFEHGLNEDILEIGGPGTNSSYGAPPHTINLTASNSISLLPENGQINLRDTVIAQNCSLTIGTTTLTEENLQDLLNLLN